MISLGNKDYKLYLGGQRMRQTIMRSDNPKSSLINERHRFSCLLIRLTSSTNKRLDIRANGRESQAWHEARLRVDYKACSRASTALQFPCTTTTSTTSNNGNDFKTLFFPTLYGYCQKKLSEL